MLIQKICGHVCRVISNTLGLGFGGSSWGGTKNKDGARSEWTYLSGLGPATMIVRENKMQSLLGYCAVNVGYDSINQSGKVLYCRWILGQKEKGDKIIIGRRSADREYARLEPISHYPETSGMEG